MRWTTPVGLPVVQVRVASHDVELSLRIDRCQALQPYRKRGKRSVQTVLQTFTVSCVLRCALHGTVVS